MNQSNNGGIWVIVAIVVGIALLGNLLGGGGSSSTSSVSTPDRNSFEHRYVTERFKQEGYSSSESKQAADAIIKFHNAQEARKNK